MKIIDCEQGTREWHQARLGIPTASSLSKILTPAQLKKSTQREGYMLSLLAERLMGLPPEDEPKSAWMTRGNDVEPRAASFYEMTRGVTVKEVGFVKRDDGRVGASPDRLVGEDGGLEIKCPSPAQHLGNLLKMSGADPKGAATTYRLQVQGCLWVCERDWWDLMSFHPEHPEALVRMPREDDVIERLADALEEFCDMLDEAEDRLVRLGCPPRVAVQEVAA